MARKRPMVASVRNMLMLAFMLLILLPYLLTSVYYIFSMVNQLHQEAAAAMSADCNLALRSLDLMLDETRRVAYLHLLDSDLARILMTEHSQYDMDYYTDEHIVLNAIKHATNLNANMLAVTFYARSGNVYQLNHVAMADEQQPAWDDDQRFYVAPAQGGDEDGDRPLTLPIFYTLYNSLGDTRLGSVRIDYNLLALLESAFAQAQDGASYSVVQDGRPLMDTGGQWAELAPALGDMEAGAAVRSARANGVRMAVLRAAHEPTRISVYCYRPDNPMGQPAMRRIMLYLMALGAMLALDLWMSWVIARQIGNSIRELSHAMNHAQHGQSDPIKITPHTLVQSEIDELKASYNAMVDRLASSARREYEIRTRQKTVAMRALESQINPHFLYNALNLIASLAQLGGQQTIRSVAISLASILRYSIKGGSIVTLEEELDETGHYINIIKLRFLDRIAVQIDVDPELLPCEVPKLLLQPLLENACKYATDTDAQVVVLGISARVNDGALLLSVSDNGPGIPDERLISLREEIGRYSADDVGSEPEGNSIGLINVHARVRARYGEPYGVRIHSTPLGCTITILLPIIRP